ncbi:tryptophanyl-tRNA synthetase [Sorangium cellulosum]|uniref:Tryptophan--tRNA ligase n=1 Tax=Sorangium cellulosum TaxID=56 RepID=A0A2L0F6U9_SORCE|nr:tryptophan--tRNA ligase [Sorangium cellulosum]AUX47231.1 tryptophanyl-tRNA synthetase [Sorangium cellulosum]
MATTVLTGIKPTGTPHLGNYVGAIKPALALAETASKALYFVADYHALNAIHDAQKLRGLVLEVAATWLALGLDPAKVVFYKQSDIPELFELSWILSCFTAKGLMNRAHAYKAAVARNLGSRGGTASVDDMDDLDAGINMGLYSYPVLMAADILLFKTNVVPVGKDQIQHIEIARDIAQRVNTVYGPTLVLPEARVSAETAVIPGLDGRKMSKSYDNTIPLFLPPEKLRKLLFKYKTDSSPPSEPKDPDTSPLFHLYREFATPEETEALRGRYRAGIGWGEAKEAVFDVLNRALTEPRRRYAELMAEPERIDALLAEGAARAREIARVTLEETRRTIGVR